MENLELVIFDLAGTTIRDSGQVQEAIVATLHASGINVSDDELQQVRGASKREVIRRLVERGSPPGAHETETQTEGFFTAFRDNLATRYIHDGVQVMPGVEETFTWLHSRKVKIALNTGFDRFITTLILQATGWNLNPVQAVVCDDDVTQGRPAPYLIFHAMESLGVSDVHRVAAVGDTVLDLQAGWNAGVRWIIGVWGGAHSREKLEQSPHTLLLPDVASLPEALSTLF